MSECQGCWGGVRECQGCQGRSDMLDVCTVSGTVRGCQGLSGCQSVRAQRGHGGTTGGNAQRLVPHNEVKPSHN